MRFRKKPVVIEAVQLTRAVIEAHLFDKAPLPEGVNLWNATYHAGNRTISHARFGIKTLEGKMEASEGDWIIRGVKGERYPCKPDIFAATYEPEQEGASEALGEPKASEHPSPNAREAALEEVAQILDARKKGWEARRITDYDRRLSGIMSNELTQLAARIRSLSPSSEGGEEKADPIREALEKIAGTEGPLLESTAYLMRRWAREALSKHRDHPPAVASGGSRRE